MGVDYTVIWSHPCELPSMLELQQTLEDYLGELGIVTDEGHKDTLFAAFISKKDGVCKGSFPFARCKDLENDYRLAQTEHARNRERWFEVAYNPSRSKVCVTTRQQDEFTSNVARGFAKLVARYWKGTLELPS